jgi:hypothetical protein
MAMTTSISTSVKAGLPMIVVRPIYLALEALTPESNLPHRLAVLLARIYAQPRAPWVKSQSDSSKSTLEDGTREP